MRTAIGRPAIVAFALMVLISRVADAQTVSVQVSGFANLYQQTDPSTRTARSQNPAVVPVPLSPGEEIQIFAPGCVCLTSALA